MKEQSAKKWTIRTVASVLVVLLLFAAFMFATDPCLYFRKESGLFTYWHYNQLYSGPGVATYYDYDTVITGSSMVGEFVTAEFDDLYDAKTIKLVYNEASARNDKAILDICFQTHPNIKRVFLPIDSFTCIYDSDQYNYPLPDYMYSKNAGNSVKYLLNLNIFYHISIKDITETMKGNKKEAMESGTEGSIYDSNWVIDNPLIPWEEYDKYDTTDYLTNTEANLTDNILPLFAMHPDTEFVLFTPPYSMLYWYRRMGTGDAVESLESMRLMIKACLRYDNVKVYGFIWDETITTKLENYRDTGHFSPEIHSELLSRIYRDEDRITIDNCDQLFDVFIERIQTFDYLSLYNSYVTAE